MVKTWKCRKIFLAHLSTLNFIELFTKQKVFQDSEAGVANMITTTMVTDSACD